MFNTNKKWNIINKQEQHYHKAELEKIIDLLIKEKIKYNEIK